MIATGGGFMVPSGVEVRSSVPVMDDDTAVGWSVTVTYAPGAGQPTGVIYALCLKG